MSIKRHGLSIGLERVDDDFFLILKPVGKLTHADYEIINPMIDDALKGLDKPHVRALVDASEFDGCELRAAWDDFRLGLKHGNAFEKLAIVGERKKIGRVIPNRPTDKCVNDYCLNKRISS